MTAVKLFISRHKILSTAAALTIAWLSIEALPLYTARSGRICDNCHMNPFKTDKQNEWPNPELADRKCNLSCSTCHIDTAGGSLRRVAGRYYAASTLPVWGTEQRPYWDHQRTLKAYWNKLTTPAPKPQKKKASATNDSKEKDETSTWNPNPPRDPKLPDHYQTMKMPPFWTMADPTVFGNPFNARPAPRTHEPLYGIYGGLNADPFLVISGNFRWLYYKTPDKDIFFPMVNELGIALHPVEKLTIAASGGVLGQATEFGAPSLPVEDRMFIRQAVVMLHELPYQAYMKAGVFTPNFGIRHEDHTIPTRRHFDMDYSRRNNGVYGAEVGLAPNYPYLSASVFTNIGRNYEETNGWGTSVTAGYRDLLYGGGLSFMHKRRDFNFGGNFTAASLDWYLNLGRLFFTVPVVFMGEFSFGERELASGKRTVYANFLELNYLIINGFNIKATHHFYDPDITVRNNETGHIGLGFDFTPLPFFRLSMEYRWAWIIPDSSLWRTGAFINPSDLQFTDNLIIMSHVYF